MVSKNLYLKISMSLIDLNDIIFNTRVDMKSMLLNKEFQFLKFGQSKS